RPRHLRAPTPARLCPPPFSPLFRRHVPAPSRAPTTGSPREGRPRRAAMQTLRARHIAVTLGLGALLAARALAVFPTTAPNDPRYAADVCPPATTCHGPTGQWNLLSFNDNVP